MELSAKDILGLVKKGITIEAQEEKIKLKEAVRALQEDNIELKQKIKELEDELNVKENMSWEPPYYFRKKENGTKDGPYCQLCYDNSPKDRRKLIRLQNAGAKGSWKCHCCNKDVSDSSYVLPAPGQAITEFDVHGG